MTQNVRGRGLFCHRSLGLQLYDGVGGAGFGGVYEDGGGRGGDIPGAQGIAVEKGASALIISDSLDFEVPSGVAVVKVEDTRTSELLASESMFELIKTLEKNYDYIIFDT